ncbi:hypothetical protein NDU88_003846 [Pleurodeles waltl]|uniref:Mediator of RNA polymerase II transcription subunit 1 n=2 Tax=Pleurodeles waltl TaxID=8319 RepID=A0AAV7VFD1_PLEWA|nr:hypothetical protein NDU88_003846 [Pleurodeles waltl]
MVNRLELLSKQKGLEYHISPTGKGCYITSEMFYVEVMVKKNGEVVDVKLAHHGEAPMVCEELLNLLRVKNFDAFGKNLEGLLAIYQVPGDRESKAKVHIALQSLEKDLMGIFMLDGKTTNSDTIAAILHGKVGHVVPRSGGSPMTVEYYASPYQLLENKLNPGSRVHGMKAMVIVGGTDALHKLPITPLLSDSQPMDSSNPVFLTLTDDLCMDLPACFYLTFPQPIPVMLCLIQKIQNITGFPVTGTKVGPLYDLIVKSTLPEDVNHNTMMEKTRFLVTLPGCQKHCYFINNCSWKGDVLMGILVSKIAFTHPQHVSPVLEVLRHQHAYNNLISSCVTDCVADSTLSDFLVFEVFPQTDTCFCITFQNPLGSSLACVAVDVQNAREIQCCLHVDSGSQAAVCTNEFIARVLQCCLSLPVTMRAVFKKAPKIEEICETERSTVNFEQLQTLKNNFEKSQIFTVKEDFEQVHTLKMHEHMVQSPKLKTEVIPPAAPMDDDEHASQPCDSSMATSEANGHQTDACSDARIFHVLDSSSEDAQPNGHYDQNNSTTDNVLEPVLNTASEPNTC